MDKEFKLTVWKEQTKFKMLGVMLTKTELVIIPAGGAKMFELNLN